MGAILVCSVGWAGILKFVAHGRTVQKIASEFGWRPGARYTNLRDVREIHFTDFGFLDINWKKYRFDQHILAAQNSRPLLTVARDVESINALPSILAEAEQLSEYAQHVIIVPKDIALAGKIERLIPRQYMLGYSVPTRYGGTLIHPSEFKRPVHLLGGRPDVQRRLAATMPVVSVDCNRFTLDASFGDYFDGKTFRKHPIGGYHRCLTDSIANIDAMWHDHLELKTRSMHGDHKNDRAA
ncbi:MAG TPA: DUF6610 family protein [Telluria sp.]|nr:DUF6610 family protein [Telluria sp.]